jgi:hypothetical protein
VSPAFAFVARRPPDGPNELTGNTLPPASHHQPLSDRATAPSRARAARGDHAPVRAQWHERTGSLRGWTGPPGRGPAGLPAGSVWQAAEPGTVAMGRFRPSTVR